MDIKINIGMKHWDENIAKYISVNFLILLTLSASQL